MRFFGALKEAFSRLLITGSVFFAGTVLAIVIGFMIKEPETSAVVLNIMPFVVLPVLIVCAFSFLFKRSGTDMFSSLPVKRHTVFFANMLSCILMTLLCYLAGILTSVICFGEYNIDIFTHLCTCIFIIGATGVGTVLTGRLFLSIVNTVIIMLVPRFLYNTVLSSIFSRLPLVIPDAPGMTKISYTSIVPQAEEGPLYLTVGIILIFAAFILFVNRKSETAEKSASSKALRIFHSGIIAFSVSLLAISIIFENQRNIAAAVLLYGVSVIVPFLYQFVSTKRVSELKYGFVALIIMAVLNIGVYLFTGIAISKLKNEQIDVKGYQIINERLTGEALAGRDESDLYVWADWEKEYEQYGYLKTLDHFITDEECCRILSQRYVESKALSEEYMGMLPYAQEQMYLTGGYARFKAVLLDESGKRFYRYVYLTHDDVKTITEDALSKDEEFLEKATLLPEAEKVKKVTCIGDSEFDKKLYQCYYEEMMECSPKTRNFNTYTVYGQCKEYMYNDKIGTDQHYAPDYLRIRVEGNENNKDFYGCYYIYSYSHPKTYEMIRAYRQPIEAEKVQELLTGDYFDYPNLTVELFCQPDKTVYPHLEEIKSEILTVERKSDSYYVNVRNENIEWVDEGPPYHTSYKDYFNVYNNYYVPEKELNGVFGKVEIIDDFFVRLSEFMKANRAELKDTTGHLILRYKAEGKRQETINIRLNITYDEYVSLVEAIGGRVSRT